MENHRFVFPKDLNSIGTLYGGTILEWFDQEAALFAYECLNEKACQKLTGVCVYAFNFIKPVFESERIRSRWQVAHIGGTSITVKGMYEKWITREPNDRNKWILFAQGYSCLCAIDIDGKPISIFLKPEINKEALKNNKEWDIVEKFKSLTRLNQVID